MIPLGRLMRMPGFKNAALRGAGIGAAAGAVWGAASDETSVLGGAFKGALAGAALGGGLKAWSLNARRAAGPARRAAAHAAATAKAGPIMGANQSVTRQPLYGGARGGVSARVGRGASTAEFEAETAARERFAGLNFSSGMAGLGAGRAGLAPARNVMGADYLRSLRGPRP